MNDTGAAVQDGSPGLLADTVGMITTVHLVVIVVLMLLVTIGIIYGSKLKRQRVAADEKVEADAVAAGVEAPPAAPDEPAPVAAPPAPTATAPVAPPPPPLEADTPPVPSLTDEPIAASAPMEANPAVEAESAPNPAPTAATAPAAGDQPVTLLKGLGPKVAARLAELGITQVGQIAALDDEAAARLDGQLGNFAGRMARDRWIEQARFLAAGDRAGFEAVFGKL